jgi:hypothetical protein
MKRIFGILSTFIVLFVLGSCKKSLLDKIPQDQISSSTFWKSANEARLALNGCYTYFSSNDNYTGYYYAYNDGATDNAFAQYPWESNATSISAGNVDATIDQGYNTRYQYIRRFNYFLDNIDKTPMDSSLKRRYIAEARVLRAFTYYELADIFGPVPLLTKSYTDPLATAVAPNPEADVIAFVLSELTSAANDLPASYAGGLNNEVGRITSGAAWAIKARVELNYGKWTDAAASAQKVMGMGYSLFRVSSAPATMDDYSGFVTFANDADKQKFYKGFASYEQQFWAANNNNSEVILQSQNINNSPYAFGNGLRTLFPPSDLGGWSSITPTQELVNAYWDRSGHTFTPPSAAQRATDYNSGSPDAGYYNEFKNRDTRLYASVLFPSNPWGAFNSGYKFTWGKGGNNNSKTGYNFRKLVDPAYTANDWDGPNNFAIIRYAEILLTYAEAQNEVSGPDPSIYAALNDIRDRSGMPPVDQSIYNTQATLRDFIHNERRIELAAEGQRYDDIRRWNIAQNVIHNINDITNDPVQQRVWKPIYMKMPYPQSALDHNANLTPAQKVKGY